MEKRKRRSYGEVLKSTAIGCAQRLSVKEASAKYKIPETTIWTWLRQEKEKKVKEVEVPPEVCEAEPFAPKPDANLDLAVARMYLSKARNTKKKFELGFDYLRELVRMNRCFYTGVELKEDEKSIERLNPFLGYTNENSVLVSIVANNEKAELDKFVHGHVIPVNIKIQILRRMADMLEQMGDSVCISDPEDREKIHQMFVELSSDRSINDVDRSRILHGMVQFLSGHKEASHYNAMVVGYITSCARRMKGVDLALVKKYCQSHREAVVRGTYK